MSELETKAVDILDKLEVLTTQYAPEVGEAALQVVQMSGVVAIGNAFACAILAVCVAKLTQYVCKFCAKKEEAERYDSPWDAAGFLSLAIGVVVGLIFLIASLTDLLNFWNWVAIFSPELALAHKLLGL